MNKNENYEDLVKEKNYKYKGRKITCRSVKNHELYSATGWIEEIHSDKVISTELSGTISKISHDDAINKFISGAKKIIDEK